MSQTELFYIRRMSGAQVTRFRPLCAVRSPYLPAVLRVVAQGDDVLLYEAPLTGALAAEPTDEMERLSMAWAAAQALLALHDARFCHGAVRVESMLRLADGGYVLTGPASAARDAAQDLRDWGAMVRGFGCKGDLLRIAKRCESGRIGDAKGLCRALERRMGREKRMLRAAGMAAAFCVVMLLGVLGMQALMSDAQQPQAPAAALPVAAPCTCQLEHYGAKIEPVSRDNVFVPGERLQIRMRADCLLSADGCMAVEHEQVKLVGCAIDSQTEGGSAQVTQDGLLTVDAPGIYKVSGIMEFREEVYYAEPATVYALTPEDMPEDCVCVFDSGESRPMFDANNAMDENGMLYLTMHMNEVIDDRLCTAQVHNRVHYALGEVLECPEGARCGVDDNNRFYCDTPGWYTLQLHFYFDGKEESATCDMHAVAFPALEEDA